MNIDLLENIYTYFLNPINLILLILSIILIITAFTINTLNKMEDYSDNGFVMKYSKKSIYFAFFSALSTFLLW